MEYYSSKIHLHRPTANFGSPRGAVEPQSTLSRRICIENAESIANAITNYKNCYGDVTTMSGIGLHMIATATTILIASIAEKQSANTSRQMHVLQVCIQGMCELEKTYFVARRVRRIIRLILGLCHIDIEHASHYQESHQHQLHHHMQSLGTGPKTRNTDDFLSLFDHTDLALQDDATNDFGLPDADSEMTSMADYAPLWMDESQVPSGYGQYDIMYNLGSF